MTTVIVEAPPASIWTRAASRLSNWGSKVVGFAKRVGNWFVSVAKKAFGYIKPAALVVWNSTPVQWFVGTTKIVSSFVWYYASKPVVWLAALFFVAPTSATILALIGLLGVGFVATTAYLAYRHLRTISTHEELVELADRVTARLDAPNGATPIQFNEEPVPGETVADRMTYLDLMQKRAQEATDADAFSETQARMHLLEVRRGNIRGIKATATPSAVHNNGRKKAEAMNPDFAWNWDLMHRATVSESARLKVMESQKTLTPVK